MSSFVFQFLDSLGNAYNKSPYASLNTTSGNPGVFSGSDATSFSTVLTQIDKTINSASMNSDLNSASPFALNNNNSNMVTPDINAIVEKIKNNNNNSYDISNQVQQYLLDNYGGSKTTVIEHLSGVQNLPSQVVNSQTQLFNEIVNKISAKVSENLFNDHKKSDFSYFYDSDNSSDSGSDDGLDL